MLKRQDLAKQFELVVKQEIINHNRQIENTNSAISEINNSIKLQLDDIKLKLKKLHANDCKLQSEHQEIYEGHSKFAEKTKGLISQIDHALTALNLKIHGFIEEQKTKYVPIQEFLGFAEQNEKTQKTMDKKLSEMSKALDWTTNRLQDQVNHSFDRFRQELKDSPNPHLEYEKKLLNRIDELRIDNEGLIREVRICKKEALINEKKIENLYTLIERINKKIAPLGKQ